jgi:uncharacterized protein (DUF1330 family)
MIVRFPSMELAHSWHESLAYKAILDYHLNSAESRAYVVEGVALD